MRSSFKYLVLFVVLTFGTLIHGFGSQADLSVTKVDSPDPVIAGNNITYTITVTNAGPSAATNAVLADTVPANTVFVSMSAPAGWSVSAPAPGGTGPVSASNPSFPVGSAVFTLVVQVDPTTANGTVISNTATAGSVTADPDAANNSSTATTTVVALADLSITKTDAPDPILAGQNITYTITAANAGPMAAASVVVSDTVPANTVFVSMSAPAGWTLAAPAPGGTGPVTATNPSFASGGSAVFSLVVQVNALTPAATVITNTATIVSDISDATPGNNTATATTTVTPGVPALPLAGLLALAALLVGIGWFTLRRPRVRTS